MQVLKPITIGSGETISKTQHKCIKIRIIRRVTAETFSGFEYFSRLRTSGDFKFYAFEGFTN